MIDKETRNKRVQAMLIIDGYDDDGKLIADGIRDKHTTMALRVFQKNHELMVTGRVNDEIVRCMQDTVSEGPELSLVTDKHVQCALILAGYDDDGMLIADGVYGKHTENAMRKYFLHSVMDGYIVCLPLEKPEEVTEVVEEGETNGATSEVVVVDIYVAGAALTGEEMQRVQEVAEGIASGDIKTRVATTEYVEKT